MSLLRLSVLVIGCTFPRLITLDHQWQRNGRVNIFFNLNCIRQKGRVHLWTCSSLHEDEAFLQFAQIKKKHPFIRSFYFFNYWLYNNNYLSSIILKITKSRNTDFWSVNKNILPCKFLREHYWFVSQISHRFGCGTRSGQDTFGTWNNIIGSLINKFNPKCLNSIIRHRRNFVKHHIFMYFQ